jgi:hypothetical protein
MKANATHRSAFNESVIGETSPYGLATVFLDDLSRVTGDDELKPTGHSHTKDSDYFRALAGLATAVPLWKSLLRLVESGPRLPV